ncbi:MAG: class I SAM-dependent methyltransferase [Pseudomonadota bacterium]|nr:class I SAM-dependent methyltransferase [Pseudomonadota bacterium]
MYKERIVQSLCRAMSSSPALVPLLTRSWGDYTLLDTGGGEKLEQYGPVRVIRPEPQAMWPRNSPDTEWARAQAVFRTQKLDDEDTEGRWQKNGAVPDTWPLSCGGVTFHGRLTAFRHVGFFPEQGVHWDWMTPLIRQAGRPVKLLNLFAYTGVASLIAAKAGAQVTHLDASKKTVTYARENAALAGLEQAPVRWIVEDARKFVAREVRRGNTYDAIILDPPKYGRGTENEVWHLLQDLPGLLADCAKLLSPSPLFFILTAYNARLSALTLESLLRPLLPSGTYESGELLLSDPAGRMISTALFSRVRF